MDEEHRDQPPTTATAPIGVVAALEEELGSLARQGGAVRERQGLLVHELCLGGAPVLAVCAGIGKVRAARAATVLLAEGATRALLSVGVCGGLVRSLLPGALVHCTRAVQVDLAVRKGRELAADPLWRARWEAAAPGASGWFLTADRPVLTPWRRVRLARAFAGPCVADMETAAIAVVAHAAGVPWAGLRAVTDGASWLGATAFRRHYPTQAGRAADTVAALLERAR